jgi:hypothetical protein
MSLRRFLNVAFNILVEEYQRMGVDLISALEKVAEWGEVAVTEVAHRASPVQNEQSMATLQGMLSNVSNAPTKKPRRA